MLTETETNLRPTIRSCSCDERNRVFLASFFSSHSVISISLDHHGLDGQSYRVYHRNGATCSLDPFFSFHRFFPSDVSPLAIVFATLEKRLAKGSHNSDVILKRVVQNTQELHAGRMRLSRVTAVAGARNMYYLLHQGYCLSVANWVMSTRERSILRTRVKHNAMPVFFASLDKIIIIFVTNTLRKIKSLPRS